MEAGPVVPMSRASTSWPLVPSLAMILLGGPAGLAAETDSSAAAGQAELERARLAYRNAGPFHQIFEFELMLPDGRREPRRQEYGVGDGAAFFSLLKEGQETFRIVARDGRMVATQFNVSGRYAET